MHKDIETTYSYFYISDAPNPAPGASNKQPGAMNEDQLIRACKKQDQEAQRVLYDTYGPVILGIIRRYINRSDEAEDVFIETMYRIMTRIDSYRGEGSFEGWMKRIAVNEALMHLRRAKNFNIVRELEANDVQESFDIEAEIFADELLSVLDQLPTGYRTVFNMYVIEGYKHREIAEELGISINTSKSQLILAKRKMRELLKKNELKAV